MEAPFVKNYIAGHWVSSRSTQTVMVENPATTEILARTPLSLPDEVQAAVNAAGRAFKVWRETPAYTRSALMLQLRELLGQHLEELARLIVQENGKTIEEARGEVRRAIEVVEGASAVPFLMQGYNLEDVATGIDEECIRQPAGVFVGIAPFNFPAMIPMWFLAYGLATGNSYILKPSERTPLTCCRILELISELDLPEGVVNLVQGSKEVVNQLLESSGVTGVSFVGSTPVAKHIYRTSAAHLKRVQSNGGAKNCLVVMPDADLSATVRAIIASGYGCAGQRCLAGSLVVAVGGIHATLRDALHRAASQLQIGYGLDAGTTMGPVISCAAQERVLHYVEIGMDEGAKLVLDGRGCAPTGYENGHFVGPTLFDDVLPGMQIARDEIFGPVLGIVRAKDLEEALAVIDRSTFGNAASIFTDSGKAARAFKYRARCGNIGVNVGIPAPVASFAFGGIKDSFFGDLHSLGTDAVNFFTERKVAITRW